MEEKAKIVFMGTPEFAVPSLQKILEERYSVVGVITAPDRPSGRGRKLTPSPVKKFAESHGLNVMQPVNLKDPSFLEELASLSPDIQVVVAFRMLPRQVWEMADLATFNLHASLLPQYRGAAPINWAIINGETETGLTTFLIDEQIDTGNILLQEKMPIGEEEDAGMLHDRMMRAGAGLVIKTIRQIERGDYKARAQNEDSLEVPLKSAPKLTRETGKINWEDSSGRIKDLIRGLSPYPGAYTYLESPEGERYLLKIYQAHTGADTGDNFSGNIITDGRSYLAVQTGDKQMYLTVIQFEGKNRMKTEEFLRGFRLDDNWRTVK